MDCFFLNEFLFLLNYSRGYYCFNINPLKLFCFSFVVGHWSSLKKKEEDRNKDDD